MSEPLDATDFIDAIREHFQGVTKPVTVEHLSQMYSVLAAQQDAMLSVYDVAIKASASALQPSDFDNTTQTLKMAVQAYRDAILDLNKFAFSGETNDGL